MENPSPQRFRFRKFLASIAMALAFMTPTTMIGITAISAGIFLPQPAMAQVSTVADIPRTVEQIVQAVVGGLIIAGYIGVRNAIRSFLEKIAYDTAVWIASGDENQKPLLFTNQAGEYLEEAGDAAAGEFLNTLASQNGFLEFNLCDLPDIQALHFQLILPKLLGKEPYTPECTFSEIKQNVSDAAETIQETAIALFDDPLSVVNIEASLDEGENALSSLLSAADQALGVETAAQREAEFERLTSEFKPATSNVSGYIQTPAFVLEAQMQANITQASTGETTLTGNLFADALSVFVNTLASKLLERFTNGILAFFTETDITESVSGGSSAAGSGGIQAAREQFASFQTPTFNPGGEVDILSEFASCPEDGADVTNCVITEGFRLAIDEGLSIQQAIDQGLIDAATPFAFGSGGEIIEDPNQGISYRNVKILKQYSVVPVGWVLAAEYDKDFDASANTLQQVIDEFDDCDASNYSPYCGLIDPNWTLKAPQVFCKVEGYGENIAATEFVDLDGSAYTPTQPITARLTSCLDTQTCLAEDDNGLCEAFGYCTKQRRIYRFDGDSCPSHQASCEQFENAEGDEVGYLKNTVNYNDCSSENDGCQWRCLVFNDVDGIFQCAGQGDIYSTCTDSAGCTGSVLADGSACTATCTILEGGFQCANESGETCFADTDGTAGPDTTSEASAGTDIAITLDNDAEDCREDDAGCHEFIPVADGANLIFNGSFESYDNGGAALADPTGADAFDDLFGFGTADENACSTYANPQTCHGWELSGATARAVNDSLYGTAAIQLDGGSTSNFMIHRFDTGQPLENRTFTLSFAYHNNTGATCNAQYWVSSDNEAAATPSIPASATAIAFSDTDSYLTETADPVTFADGTTDTMIVVGFSAGDSCDIILDGVKLEEQTGSTGYVDYASTDDRIYINTSQANSCTVDEVGCELYTPQTGETELAVPGIITNVLADACGNGTALDNASCSQCEAEFVGCDSFIQEPTVYNAPIVDITGFTDYLDAGFDADLAAAVAGRTGYYCEGTTTACSPDREALDCTGGEACLPAVSLIPETGETCSANNVGCEEYVNLDEVEAGGEGLEYYSYIKQCVKPTTEQETAGETDTFYTFEGSDISGYQLRAWELKVSDVDSGPCTNLDLYGATAESSEADCIDGDEGLAAGYANCLATDVGVDADCSEFFDTSGNTYYRYKSRTITVSEDCLPLRNNTDDRIYYSIPDESTSCPASANQCREYKGSQGGNVQIILSENFDESVWDGGNSSSETVTANVGLSMAIGTDSSLTDTSGEASEDVASLLDEANSYVVSFWAKSATAGSIIRPFFYTADSNTYYYFDEQEGATDIILTDEWQLYSAGPFVFTEGLVGDETFGFEFTDAIAYVDNVEVRKNDSHYLILNSYDSCYGYEGCEEYEDTDNTTHYLKSFASLCSEQVVGCSALIDTENSDTPFYANYNEDNEFSRDDVAVAADSVETWVVNDDVLCDSDVASCTEMGLPDLDEDFVVESFATQYLLNDPDTYDTILCQEQQRSCQEFTDSQGSLVYFKDPGDRTCSYDSGDGVWKKADGTACPLQNDNESPSQPKGPVCNGGLRDGNLCNVDSDCPADVGDTNTYRCVNDYSDDSGYTGICQSSYSGCTLYVDPNMDTWITNSDFEADVKSNTDITSGEPDGLPDEWQVLDDLRDTGDTNNFTDSLPTAGTVACSTFEQTSAADGDPVFDRDHSVLLASSSASDEHCMISPEETFEVDPNQTYTLRANVYTTNASAKFSVGLVYFDASGNELDAGSDPESYAFAAFEGSDRSADDAAGSEDTPATDQWVRFHGTIGPNLAHSFPDDTFYVKVFLERSGNSGNVYFDNVEFAENGEYTYINNTVDGTSQSDTNTCSGEISIETGCVAFRDTTDDSMLYTSNLEEEEVVNTSFTTETCTFDSALGYETCASRENTADTNVVLSVRNDRECAEWLACKNARVETDESGNVESSTCFAVGRCLERNEDTGVCTDWADSVNSSELGTDDDLSVISQPGNTEELLSIEDTSGFATAGAEWIGTCSSGSCVGGANAGTACSTNAECETAQISYGYYPYEWMPERGLGGAASTTDLVRDGDFEDVFCDGANEWPGDSSSGLGENAVLSARDKSAKCTLDIQCRTNSTEARVEQLIAQFIADGGSSSDEAEDIDYHLGWCGNFVDTLGVLTWGDYWTAYGDAAASIIDYSDEVGYAAVLPQNGGDQIAADTLDFNNSLYVKPTNNAQSGVNVDLGTEVVQGDDYVVSFNAKYATTPDTATDFIQVGLQHGTDTSAVDFFEVGSAMADVVFVVDASSSMGGEIASVADATSDMVAGFEAAGIDFQTSIVTVGGTRAPSILDFTDYSGGEATEYGATNGYGTTTTSDPAVFEDAMDAIAGSLDGGSAYNLDGLADTMENDFDGDVIDFRPGAQRYLILLTDTHSAEGTPIYTDELDLITDFGDFDVKIFTVVNSTYADDYDDLTAHYGGGTPYNITGDYSEILTEIVENIDETTSSFQFSTDWESYVLGPITIENKDNASDATNLFIGQSTGASNTGFLIDDLSMKPALEVNKENNPNSENAPWMVSRTCRGYPGDDSYLCDYTDAAGAIYQGWKGYCLEHDELDPKKCVTWWPVDIISGEPDTTGRARVTYSDKYPAYHCLVAKGNEDLGACESDGRMCASDSDCSTGTCLGNSSAAGGNEATFDQSYGDDESFDSAQIHDYDTGDPGYTVTHTIQELRVEHSGADSGTGQAGDDVAIFKKFDTGDLPVEQLVHISEIDRITYDMGNPTWDGESCGSSDPDDHWLFSGVNGFDTANFEEENPTGSGPTADDGLVFWNTGRDDGSASELCGTGADSNPVYAFQRGAWCGEGSGDICAEDITAAELDDIDFVFTKAIVSVENEAYLDVNQSVWNGTSGSNSPFNPFNAFSNVAVSQDGGADGSAWDKGGSIDSGNVVEGTTFDDDFFFSEYTTQIGGGTTDSCYGNDPCGGNIHAVNFNFEDGYLEGVYLIYWNGLKRGDTENINNIDWTFYLKEPCLLLVQGADDEANAVPWRTRASSDSSYQIPDIGYTYTMSPPAGYSLSVNNLYGSWGGSGSSSPAEIDGEDFSPDTTQVYDFFGVDDPNLPMVYLNDGQASALPYSCIGACTDTRCQGDYTGSGGELDGGACDDDKWISLQGICSELDDEGNAQMCDDESTCDNGTCQDITTIQNRGDNLSTYFDQLSNALEYGWEHYRLLFADIQGKIYYAAPGNGDRTNSGSLTAVNQSTFDSAFDDVGDFSSMTECSGDRDEDDYCGIRPDVDNIRVNNATTGDLQIANGDTVALVFDSDADADQEPIQTIRIAWEGGGTGTDFDLEDYITDPWEAASTEGHSYTFTYTCDPTSSDYDESSGFCEYRIKVQVEDNWGFCSGDSRTSTTRSNVSPCSSYDAYDGVILVSP